MCVEDVIGYQLSATEPAQLPAVLTAALDLPGNCCQLNSSSASQPALLLAVSRNRSLALIDVLVAAGACSKRRQYGAVRLWLFLRPLPGSGCC